jgi:hypothetical protein
MKRKGIIGAIPKNFFIAYFTKCRIFVDVVADCYSLLSYVF